jgi:hypothetical protein
MNADLSDVALLGGELSIFTGSSQTGPFQWGVTSAMREF